jgi:uncharacterized protein (TIGR03118 family)
MKTPIVFALSVTLLASTAHAAGYKVTNLVSNQPGVAMQQDADLVNPWGLCQDGDSAPVWASDEGSNKSTFYDRTTGLKETPVVAIPNGLPTGCVAVPTGINFNLTKNGLSGRAYFLFDSISGFITGWAPAVDENNAIVGQDSTAAGSVFTGLALDTTNKHLLAADFKNNQVVIFDTSFNKVSSFTDPNAPKKFAPFNVAVIGKNVYVAYAKPGKDGATHKAGAGQVDVFDLSGNLQKQLIAGGSLNAPWGMAIAPASWGDFSGDLLVGNFGDGKINAFDPTTGAFVGTVGNKKGKALKFDGLWSIDPGPGKSTVTISAGPDGETNGLIALVKPN